MPQLSSVCTTFFCFIFLPRYIFLPTPELFEPVLRPRTALFCGDELMREQQQATIAGPLLQPLVRRHLIDPGTTTTAFCASNYSSSTYHTNTPCTKHTFLNCGVCVAERNMSGCVVVWRLVVGVVWRSGGSSFVLF